MEPLTVGQKIAFACVVLFVVTLTSLTFVFRSEPSAQEEPTPARREGLRNTMMSHQ